MRLSKMKLTAFCGIEGTYEISFDELTVLVGPNNGGKTTLLRAIQFASAVVGDHIDKMSAAVLAKNPNGWEAPLREEGKRLGVQDFSHMFYRRKANQFAIELQYESKHGIINLELKCRQRETEAKVGIKVDGKPFDEGRPRDQREKVIEDIRAAQAQLIPPVGTINPMERLLSRPELQTQLANGRYSETWRNQILWFHNSYPELFNNVVQLVTGHMNDVTVIPPKLTEYDTPPNVIINYYQDKIEYDIASAGAGLRTLLSLAAAMEQSPAKILLFDEPDSHLHSALQRQVATLFLTHTHTGKQFILTTHAPDVIDEMPLESLRWVDKTQSSANKCDDVGKALISLGAVSHHQAIQTLGGDVLLYFEAKPDRVVLNAVLQRFGKDALIKRSRQALLKGYGAIQHLPELLKMLKAIHPMKIATVAVRDADYLHIDPKVGVSEADDVLVLTLPCKELENLLLVSGKPIAEAAQKVANAKASYTSTNTQAPSVQEVEAKIDELTKESDVRDAIETQWLCCWGKANKGLNQPDLLKQALDAFGQRWANPLWRRRCCPGKLVLAKLRRWLQEPPWHLGGINLPVFFAELEIDAELKTLFDKLEEFVNRVTA